MKIRDDNYNLSADFKLLLQMDKNQCLEINEPVINLTDYTLLLEINYESLHKKKQGIITVSNKQNKKTTIENAQFFEANQQGIRYLNVSDYDLSNKHYIHCENCKISNKATLLAFKNPDFTQAPILIISPHADDAEIAAYGFYQKHNKNTWITTLNSGDSLQALKRQYIKGLDTNMEDATLRKGKTRAWNSMTTPLLAGVPFKNLSSLGYFKITLDHLYEKRKEVTSHPVNSYITPKEYRIYNDVTLPNDIANINSGDALINDLKHLIQTIKPSTILVTHPRIDPHPEHITAAHSLAIALEEIEHKPEHILLYVNHLENIKGFPYGPEHAKTALPPSSDKPNSLHSVSHKCYSFQLTSETQKDKIIALDSMHDLRSKYRFERAVKQWWNKSILKNDYHYYADNAYLQTHIKANEVFLRMDANQFLRLK